MSPIAVEKARNPLTGSIQVPGDKSISHRFIIFGALAEGVSSAENFLTGEDCLHTITAFQNMGVSIELRDDNVKIKGIGLQGLKAPSEDLYLGNSGTSMRLLSGLLSAQSFSSKLTGDASLSKRPMQRVIEPLTKMGAKIKGEGEKGLPPLEIQGSKLNGIYHQEKKGSAQVKSAVLLAGLFADGETIVEQKKISRDHTERMFQLFGSPLSIKDRIITLDQKKPFRPVKNFMIPSDISSAAFFIVAACLIPDSQLTITNVSLNPTRKGLLDVLLRMGANIQIKDLDDQSEPRGTLVIQYAKLTATTVQEEELPFLIDEIPILLIAFSLAKGQSKVLNASELRVKESDRISVMQKALEAIGADVQIEGDTIIINGKDFLEGGAEIDSCLDHRIAMSMAIAGLLAEEPIRILGADCINTSFPQFWELIQYVTGRNYDH